ncbi:hypothetical protein [Streptomyces sp. NPDC015414]|uniref:hypothetical protein n=1 Tax=unclassified Streptomyces TaxID=2593676 RepID=UPI0036FBE2BC
MCRVIGLIRRPEGAARRAASRAAARREPLLEETGAGTEGGAGRHEQRRAVLHPELSARRSSLGAR